MTTSTPKPKASKKPTSLAKAKSASKDKGKKVAVKPKAKEIVAKKTTRAKAPKTAKPVKKAIVKKKADPSKISLAAKKAGAKNKTVTKSAVKKPSTAKKSVRRSTGRKTKISATSIKPPTTKPISTAKTTRKLPTVKKATTTRSASKTVINPKIITPKTQDIRKSVQNLESRMKRANTLNRKSVKALESAVMALDARTRKDNSTGKAALTRKVNQLSAKLTDMVAQTQAEVSSELKTALNNPTAENLQAALFRANQRMDMAEQNQAAAISKVNRHLSAIATAVDARIGEEAQARQAAISILQTETRQEREALGARLDTIEIDTAQALSRVGDKIAELSGELTQRGDASELSIREKVSEIALQTQTEFENYRSGLERRIDEVSQNSAQNDTQRLEHSIASLTARLEGLEYAVANPPQIETPTPMAVPSAPQLSVVSSQAVPLMTPPQAVSHEQQLPDAFSPLSNIPEGSAVEMHNPYLTTQAEATPYVEEIEREAHEPVEFDPNKYTVPEQRTVTNPPPPEQPAEPLRDFNQAEEAPAPLPVDLAALPPLPTSQTMPFSDPAYAETNPTMEQVRISGDADSRFNLPKLTGRNLRVAALATGVAVVGLVAAKGVFGNNDNTPVTQQTAQSISPQSTPKNSNTAPVSIPTPDTSAAPIGDYADNKAVEIAPSSNAAKTLNSAAAAGDPVAQFQLGLSYLEQGRTDEGVTLIRKSANQNQPAAQYRLAKLYEIGEGVTQDSNMARQLTERAATNGNRIAMHDLALYYAEGRGGVEANLPTAAKWFEKAAERGVVDSQFNLGVLFESGQGLPKNVNDAFVWYSIAAAQGDQFAKTRVDVLTNTLDKTDLENATSRIKKFKLRKINETANGIFRNVAWGKSNDKANEKISQVRQVQTMLTELGYEIGGADGSIGPKTRAAIMNFERANSLPETGRVNTALIDRLELATGA